MKFILTDIDHDGSKIRLLGESEKGERIVLEDDSIKPFFYAAGISEDEIRGMEGVTSTKKEKDRIRVNVSKTEYISLASEQIIGLGGTIKERDIPFTQKYLIEKGLRMLEGVDSETLKHCEMEWKPRILAIDIETTNKKSKMQAGEDEVLMISMYSNYGIKKVMLIKGCEYENTECYKTEKEMLISLSKTITETKPSIIVTYNGDNFDWPFIRDRMNKYKLEMNYGYDGSRMTIIKKETSATARIKGLSHVDLYAFVDKILSAQLKTSTLDLASVSKELIGNTKKDIDWEDFYYNWENGDLKEIIEYSLTDAQITYELFSKLKEIIYELAKLTNEPIYETARSSYSVLVENYLINRTRELGEDIPPRPTREDVITRARSTYAGGYVREPKPGVYENIAVMDFRSLYPSIIVSYNIDPETIGKKGIEVEVDGKKYTFGQEKQGFIPHVVKDLVETRAKIKKELKTKKDPILEARSSAIKTITNATYGYLGYMRSRWYSAGCAESITALGRKHVKEVISEAEDSGLNVIYGDTDSTFVVLGNKTREDINKFLEEVNKKLPGIMELELERICPRGIFISGKKGEGIKKRYALIDDKGELIIKGFEFVRGDWSDISRKTQYKVFLALLKDNSREKAISEVRNMIIALKENKVPLKELIIREQITMPLNSYRAIGPHVAVAKRLADKGLPITPGTMIGYLITEGKGLIREKARTMEEIEEGKLKIDAEYYIHHQVLPAVDRILDVIDVKEGELKGSPQKSLDRYF